MLLEEFDRALPGLPGVFGLVVARRVLVIVEGVVRVVVVEGDLRPGFAADLLFLGPGVLDGVEPVMDGVVAWMAALTPV